jgi:hypothetical protein
METLLQTEVVHVACYGDLFFVLWKQKATGDDYRRVHAQKRVVRARLGNKPMASMTVVRGSSVAKPTAELQSAINEHAAESRGWLKADALVIDAQGFSAALMRSIIAGVMIVKGLDHPHKVFSNVAAACEWTAPHVRGPSGAAVTPDELLKALSL